MAALRNLRLVLWREASLGLRESIMIGCPIGLVSTGREKFSEETSSEPCKWVMWIRDVGAMRAEGAKFYLWVPL
jgi:hypothetical protein